MERSEPDDGAWDDPLDPNSQMWRLPGEAEYPLAPIPVHERRWRHPSELGHAEWVQSERSAGLGRGLMITSGAIGCILGLAVVWLMVPAAGPSTADPAVTRSDLAVPTTEVFGMPASTASATTLRVSSPASSATLPVVVTVPAAPTTAGGASPERMPASSVALLLPAEDLPTNTVWLKSSAKGSESAVAVLVGDAPYMITTATAVGSVETVRVLLASGDMTNMPVVSVDGSFAYLQTDESLRTFGFTESAVALEGDSLTVLADDQVVFTYGDDTLARIDPGTIAEGTPVVNEDGALVGLCTGARGTVSVVPIRDAFAKVAMTNDTVAATQPTSSSAPTAATPSSPATSVATVASTTTVPPSTTTSSTSTTTSSTTTTTSVVTTTTVVAVRKRSSIGIRLGADSVSPLTITSISAGSPADAAGLVVGEQIVAIDGVVVANADAVAIVMEEHAPGDVIVVTAASLAADGATHVQRDVSVVLGDHTL